MATRKDFITSDPQVVSCPPIFAKGQSVKLVVRCATCLNEIEICIGAYWKRRRHGGPWSCHNCLKPAIVAASKENKLYKDPEYRKKFAALHDDPTYHKAVHNENVHQKISASLKESWADHDDKDKRCAYRRSPVGRAKQSARSKSNWENDEYRQKQEAARSSLAFKIAASARTKALWRDLEYRTLITSVLHKARPNSAPRDKISSLAMALYGILDRLGINYNREGPETVVGPFITSTNVFEGYSFDCLITHNGRKLYVECNGEYWHRGREARDAAKATFLANHVPEAELLTLWEHQFRGNQTINTIISERLNITKTELVNFDIGDILVSATDFNNDFRNLFSQYHYMGGCGRSGTVRVGASIGDKIIAGAIFAHPTRQESAHRLKLPSREVLELTRFCIDSAYQRKNLASWFLSRAVKVVSVSKPHVKCLLTFADTTHGHSGTIYKAANWTYDGKVRADYWYADNDNCWYHKKTIWDLASKNSMTETVYATTHGLRKIMGSHKLRFIKRI